jgi:TDG/mug DNA glycosylase family protein
MRRLSRAEEELGRDQSVPDLVAPDLGLLIVGINPSLSSGASGYHFATASNRLWPALYGAGITDRLLAPRDTEELVASGVGITNLVNRATRTAAEVSHEELRSGAITLRLIVDRWRPAVVAVLGIGAFRRAFDQPRARKGRQPAGLGASQLWLLPNPSGINAYYSVARLTQLFRLVREARDEARKVV